jgi:hypothetical protein
MKLFEACNFKTLINSNRPDLLARDFANDKLSKYLANCPRVYGYKDKGWGVEHDEYDTHTAILFDIQEIVKEPCVHEPSSITTVINGQNVIGIDRSTCGKCGARIKPTGWEAVK